MTIKPKDSQWTDDQWRAITEHGHNILVAAAAGSGKTAVLVERMIRKITDQDHPVSIDHLLVVTFTKAAASEMKERIGKALDREIAAHPESLYLRRQQSLLGRASIMTLHAFCMSVVKRYYYFLDLDPGFRLLDETEAALMREEVLTEILEEHYGSDDPEFFKLADRYSGDRSDESLQKMILKLYNFSQSHPWPERWLDQMSSSYETENKKSIDDFNWSAGLKKSLSDETAGLLTALEEARRLAMEPGGPAPYAETLTDDINALRNLSVTSDTAWETIRSSFMAISFDKMKAARGKDIDQRLKEQSKKIRDRVKDRITEIQQQWFGRSEEECMRDLQDMTSSVSLLRELVGEFSNRFKSEKRSKGLLDFSDLEHDCLAILRSSRSAPEDEHPSVVAEQYRAQFEEILVDEYQDTNRVQEAILHLISRDGGEQGNLFMVGDVKQSIYGFRLADPGLFIQKYKRFSHPDGGGVKIDLSSNFRSRREIIAGTNFIFKQLMDEKVGGITYDDSAALRYGADYPDNHVAVDLEIIDRSSSGEDDSGAGAEDLQSEELEALAIADRIEAMMGNGSESGFRVTDRRTRRMRALKFRDIAILMRSANTSAAVMIDILRQRGIPAYAELSSGYFDTVEVSVMISLLKIIDNPIQDIPLASVLRSPIVGLDGDGLAAVRMTDRAIPFYQAIRRYIETNQGKLSDQLTRFIEQLGEWRDFSRNHSVAALIWQIYRDTGYYEYVGGLSAGAQRQANLKALYDRARQYEKTSFRGLFRFLHFIGQMRENGGDLGEARALSEQEDVVRIMTIHKSKGLEFPVVFVAGLDKKFNLRDTAEPALLHKTLGFGTRWIDPEKRMSVPMLPYLAIKEQIKAETIAEEMRILYVAVTRAREKLILAGAVKDAEKKIQQWLPALHSKGWLLPDAERSSGQSFLDWIGPCVARHSSSSALHEIIGDTPDYTDVSQHSSSWKVHIVSAAELIPASTGQLEDDRGKLERIRRWQAVESRSGLEDEIRRRLEWTYPRLDAALHMAKQTVTEIKSQQEYFSEGQDDRLLMERFPKIGGDRPRFLQQGSGVLSATERGTAMHMLMQHLDLTAPIDPESIRRQGKKLVDREILTCEQENSLDYEAVSGFLKSSAGKKMRFADKVTRECPFSLVIDADKVYPDWGHVTAQEGEKVLVQGVIDCIIEDSEGIMLLDYKTDHLSSRFPDLAAAKKELIRRYRLQLALYRTAIEKIWKRPVVQVGLYAFDGGYYLDLTPPKGARTE
ncbi:helicase-exonuclease AddAB subunit AddA [Sporolactobacillus sp. THM7-4]|nr:helicase-exonuclease AddAB subunit AddA [Sporolactobacillus sp. THM7-4]